MRKISFRTDTFPTAPEGALDYSEGLPGSDAGRWIRGAVEAAGLPCNDLIQENYGWGFWLSGRCRIWVAVSYVGGDQGSVTHPPEWVVSVSHEHGFLAPSQWFNRPPCRPLVEEAFKVIEAALASRPDMSIQRGSAD
jgi:hypothetical protein